MMEQVGGGLNLIAVLIPCLVGLFYVYRCLFATDALIDQHGLGGLRVYDQSDCLLRGCAGYRLCNLGIHIPSRSIGSFCIWNNSRCAFSHIWLGDRKWQMG